MDAESLRRLRRQVESGQSVTSEMVAQVLHLCREQSEIPNRVLAFYLTKCNADGFREDDLIDFMYDQLAPYVCSKDDYEDLTADKIMRLSDVVREAFRDSKTTGEPGEVLLYVLLESRDIVQLYSKMDLKTSGQMAFHGFDALHIQVGENVVLHFGHAKNHASLSSGLKEALEDVEKFSKNPKQKRREVRLVSRNLDKARFGKASETIRKMILPYGGDKENYREASSIFLGSEWPFTKVTPVLQGSTFDAHMVTQYGKEIDGVVNQIVSALDAKTEISGMNFLFLILPITDVAEFRAKFLKRLG